MTPRGPFGTSALVEATAEKSDLVLQTGCALMYEVEGFRETIKHAVRRQVPHNLFIESARGGVSCGQIIEALLGFL